MKVPLHVLLLYIVVRCGWCSPDDTVPGKETVDVSANDTAGNVRLLDTIMVSASRRKPAASPVIRAETEFSSVNIETTAGTAGDICRYIATLPSAVSSLGEHFDNTLYVRGGRPSEVLFVVDGIEMENINHFSQANGSGGPVGFINGDFVKNVGFHAGAAPVVYPSRLSSVVAIDMKNGSFTEHRHSVGCKLTGGMLSSEGPLPGGKCSYVIAGRYIDFSLLDRLTGDRGIPRLGDLFLKNVWAGTTLFDCSLTGLFSYNSFIADYPLIEPDALSATTYRNRLEEHQRILQGGCGITARFGPERKHRVQCSFSMRDGSETDSILDYRNLFFLERFSENPIRVDRDRRYRLTLSAESVINPDEGQTLRCGIRIHGNRYDFFSGEYRQSEGPYTFCYDNKPVQAVRTVLPLKRSMLLDGLESGGYIEWSGFIAGGIEGSVGIRADHYLLTDDIALSPRAAFSLRHRTGLYTIDGAIRHQFPTDMPTMLFRFFAPFPQMDDDSALVLTRGYLKRMEPLRCVQASLGYERSIASQMKVKGDCYCKWYDREYHFVSPQVQEVFRFNNDGALLLYPQNGRRIAYGGELSLSGRHFGLLEYTAGGSLFDVQNRYRNGEWYDDWTNVRYTLSLTAGVRLFSHHLLSIGMQRNGGRPFCRELVVGDCLGRKSAVYDTARSYYSERLDPLTTAHLRYGFEKTFGRVGTELFLEVLNVFDSRPTLEYRFNGEGFDRVQPFGAVPIVGCRVSW